MLMSFKDQFITATAKSRNIDSFLKDTIFPEYSGKYAFQLLSSTHSTYRFPNNLCINSSSCYAIIATLSGLSILTTNDSQYSLQPNSVAWIDCQENTSIEIPRTSSGWTSVILFIHGTSLDDYYNEYIYTNKHLVFNNITKAINLCGQINSQAKLYNPTQEILISKLLCDLITMIILESTIVCKFGNYPNNIIQIMQYIEENYRDPLSLDSIASHFAISKYCLSHTFKKHVNQPLMDYIIDYRITVSKNLLITTSLTVTEIALLSGFSSTNNYILQFKKRTNSTPLVFRQRNQIRSSNQVFTENDYKYYQSQSTI